jgi:hypothetical protein
MKSLKYIQNYQLIFRKVAKEAQKKEVDRYVLSAKNKNKAMWKLINKESGNTQQICNIIINDGGEIITNLQIVSDKFNIFFTELIEDLSSQNNYPCLKQNLKFQIKNCPETMFVARVTLIEVEQAIKSLKSNSSAGFDEIPMPLVKQCLYYFVKPLVHIYNVSFQTGIFPDMMKKGKIRPVFKKGDRPDVQNYRPISILSVFSKILEKLMYNRLLSFLKKHNTLTLSDPTSDLVRHYDFPVPLQCRKTSDTFFVAFVLLLRCRSLSDAFPHVVRTRNPPTSFQPKINKSWGVRGWQKNWIGKG